MNQVFRVRSGATHCESSSQVMSHANHNRRTSKPKKRPLSEIRAELDIFKHFQQPKAKRTRYAITPMSNEQLEQVMSLMLEGATAPNDKLFAETRLKRSIKLNKVGYVDVTTFLTEQSRKPHQNTAPTFYLLLFESFWR